MTKAAGTCEFEGQSPARPGPVFCDLPISDETTRLCILHEASTNKSPADFRAAIETRKQEADEFFRFDFVGVHFPRTYSFGDQKYDHLVDISMATFQGVAEFAGSTFATGLAAFRTSFRSAAHFSSCEFDGEGAEFAQAKFYQAAVFNGSTFTDALFSATVFRQEAQFTRTSASGKVVFDRTIFLHGAQFSRARPSGKVEASGAVSTSRQRLSPVYAKHLDLAGDAEIALINVDLPQASFAGTDLSRIKFVGCTWAKTDRYQVPLTPWGLGLRGAIYDEVLLAHPEPSIGSAASAAEVGDLYRQLRLNLESVQQEIEASSFFIGQMDMRQHDPGLTWVYRHIGLPAYKLLAMYGESARLPTIILLFTSLFFALAYMLAGFEGTSSAPIHYGWGFDPTPPFQLWRDFAQAYAHALSAGGLLNQSLTFDSWWAPLVRYINAIWDLLVFSLIVVALRRRFHK